MADLKKMDSRLTALAEAIHTSNPDNYFSADQLKTGFLPTNPAYKGYSPTSSRPSAEERSGLVHLDRVRHDQIHKTHLSGAPPHDSVMRRAPLCDDFDSASSFSSARDLPGSALNGRRDSPDTQGGKEDAWEDQEGRNRRRHESREQQRGFTSPPEFTNLLGNGEIDFRVSTDIVDEFNKNYNRFIESDTLSRGTSNELSGTQLNDLSGMSVPLPGPASTSTTRWVPNSDIEIPFYAAQAPRSIMLQTELPPIPPETPEVKTPKPPKVKTRSCQCNMEEGDLTLAEWQRAHGVRWPRPKRRRKRTKIEPNIIIPRVKIVPLKKPRKSSQSDTPNSKAVVSSEDNLDKGDKEELNKDIDITVQRQKNKKWQSTRRCKPMETKAEPFVEKPDPPVKKQTDPKDLELSICRKGGAEDETIIVEVHNDKDDDKPLGTGDLDGNLDEGIPPGREEFIELEEFLTPPPEELESPEEAKENELDEETMTKVEEQIFSKIRFYKEVKAKVREKPWFLRKKMKLRSEAIIYTARFEGNLAGGRSGPGLKDRFVTTWTKMSREISNYAALMVPWEGRIKNIESYFGSVVASYFIFLRWLFWINFVMSLICGVAIIMPEVMFGPDFGSLPYKSIPVNETKEAAYFKTLWNFDGYAEVSPMFYGYYSNIKRYDSGFRMPFAYLVGNIILFGYSFLTILRQIAANSKDDKASDKDDNFTFAWKTFTSWDYMIGNEETAKNKYKETLISVRESVTESQESAKKIKTKTKVLRVLANFIILCILASGTYGIYLAVSRSKVFEERKKTQGPESVSWLESNEVTLVMTFVSMIFPMLFDLVSTMEDYHPRVALQWSLRRLMVLYLLNLYTLYIALYWKIQDIATQAKELTDQHYASLNMSYPACPESSKSATTPIITDLTNQTTELPCGPPPYTAPVTCWETMVGQELIKLTMFDLVTTVATIYITEFFRAGFIRVFNSCWCWDLERFQPAYAEFSLAENLLHLVYNQGMIWMGTLFCPGLPMFNLFKLLVLFYVRVWTLMACNVPHERIFKAGSDNFYLMLLLFMLYVVMIPTAFALVAIQPSRVCGPYQDQEFMYHIITQWMRDVFHPNLFAVFKYLTSPGALIPILILLFLCIYYLSSSNEALQGSVLDLKKQLQYERTEGKKRAFKAAAATEAAGAGKSEKPPLSGTASKVNSAPSTGAGLMAARFAGKLKSRIAHSDPAQVAS